MLPYHNLSKGHPGECNLSLLFLLVSAQILLSFFKFLKPTELCIRGPPQTCTLVSVHCRLSSKMMDNCDGCRYWLFVAALAWKIRKTWSWWGRCGNIRSRSLLRGTFCFFVGWRPGGKSLWRWLWPSWEWVRCFFGCSSKFQSQMLAVLDRRVDGDNVEATSTGKISLYIYPKVFA